MKRIFLLLVCTTLLFGCATTHMIQPDQPPSLSAQSDAALLVIVRDAFFGKAIVFWNYLDGKFIGETMGKTYFVTQVPPGKHYVVASTENTGVAHFNFKAGRRYFLRQGIAMGMWTARTSGFHPMTSAEAQEAIKNCTYLELDTSKTFPDMDPELYKTAIKEYKDGVRDDPDGYAALLKYKGE